MSTWTYDITSNIGKVRLHCADTDTTGGSGANMVFSDEELQVFLDDQEEDVLLAAADTCDCIAANQSRLGRVVQIGNYREDTSKVADSFRKQADRLRARVENEPAAGAAEQNLTVWAGSELAWVYDRESEAT